MGEIAWAVFGSCVAGQGHRLASSELRHPGEGRDPRGRAVGVPQSAEFMDPGLRRDDAFIDFGDRIPKGWLS